MPHGPAESWFDGATPLPRYDEELRTIAVVGSGASKPLVSIADDLATELEDSIEGDHQERLVELDRLEKVYGLDPGNFETRLTAICRTPEAERKVRKEISERYRHRHPSLLTYEILAHLLQHRFLDAIISFNFDELLDQSIDDEMGPGEYARVVSARDLDLLDEEDTAPLYVKMHGTAAEPDSLRFIRERYYWIPESIVDLVERQFDVEHLVLINLGFRMASFDFQYLLRKPKQLEIYHLDPVALSSSVTLEIENQRAKERRRLARVDRTEYDEPTLISFPAEDEEEVGPEFLGELLADALARVKERCMNASSGPAHWRSTLRHRAVVKLLEGSDTTSVDHYANYLRRRTILEIAFAAAKGRGVVSIVAMVNDRCGRYYDLYKRKAGKKADSWARLCMAGGLVESPAWPDTYHVLETVQAERSKQTSMAPSIHQLRLADPEKLAVHTMRSMDVHNHDVEHLTELLTETLTFLQCDTDIEVHSRDDRICSKSFADPLILKTLTMFRGWTREMLRTNGDYDELMVVSESGGWLEDKSIQDILRVHRCKTIKLLTAFDTDLSIPDIEIKREMLPWGRHNRHMTILCRKDMPVAAIYFVRRLRAPTVTPVYLSERSDLDRVRYAFDELWKEAEVYAESVKGGGEPVAATTGP